MIIRWRCACMETEDQLVVPDKAEGENLHKWMDRELRPRIGDRHRELSPKCNSRKLETLRYLIEGGTRN